MRRFALSALFGLLVFLAYAPQGLLHPSPEAVQGVSNCNKQVMEDFDALLCCFGSPSMQQCLDQGVGEIAEGKDIPALLKEFEAAQQQSSALEGKCHPVIHAVGRLAAKRLGSFAKAFHACTHTCHAGCYHGAMETVFFTEEELREGIQHLTFNELQPRIAGACDPLKLGDVSKASLFQCQHGLGHAILFTLDYNLEDALHSCDLLKTPYGRSSCAIGVFMENVGAAEQEKRNLDPADPLYPCNAIAERYQADCFRQQTKVWLYLGFSDEQVAETCRSLPHSWDLCFQGLGRDLSRPFREGESVRATRACEELSGEWSADCIGGMVYGLIDHTWDGSRAYEYCSALTSPENTSLCYSLANQYLHSLYEMNEEALLQQCEAFAGEGRELCIKESTFGYFAELRRAIAHLLSVSWRALRVTPRIGDAFCQFGESKPEPCMIPLRVRSDAPNLTIRFSLDAPERHPKRYHLTFAGCLQELRVNGIDLKEGVPFCDDGMGRVLDLSSALHKGENTLMARIDHGSEDVIIHRFGMRPARTDPLILGTTALLLTLLIIVGLFAVFLVAPKWRSIGVIFLFGVLLRLLYVIATPYSTRAYDWQGHVQYLQYMAEHLRIPPAQFGWETYQPPLFYFLSALFLKAGMALESLQVFTLLLSLGAFVLSLWIASLLFSPQRQKVLFLLSVLLLATWPSTIFFASRLSNDALYHLLNLAFLAFLLRFYLGRQKRDWYFASVLIGLSMLTKSSALLLLPIAYLTLLFMRPPPWSEKGKHILHSLGIVAVIAGWFLVRRFLFEGETSLVGNIERLDPFSRVTTSLSDFLTFNPLRILQCPFPVDLSDICGRSRFFEYFFRTMILGGFSFGEKFFPLSMLLLTAGMAFIPLMVFGLVREIRSRAFNVPLCIALAVLLLGHIGYRILYPYSMNQDFRFSMLLLIPLTYYLVKGIDALQGWARDLAMSVITSFSLVSSLFIVTVYLFS